MTQTARVVEDAETLYVRSLNLPASAGYTTEQFRYKRVLSQLAGTQVTLLDGIQRGVAESVYVLLPDGMVDHGKRSIKSPVMAIPKLYVSNVNPTDDVTVPVEESSPQAWWSKEGLNVVRIFTSWVDGFMAFTPK